MKHSREFNIAASILASATNGLIVGYVFDAPRWAIWMMMALSYYLFRLGDKIEGETK